MKPVNSAILTAVLGTVLMSCQTGQKVQTFKSMSPEELAEYNFGRPIKEQVHCIKRKTLSSRIPRTTCDTIEYFVYENLRNAATLEVSQPGVGRAF